MEEKTVSSKYKGQKRSAVSFNPVAKHSNIINKPKVQENKYKQYKRSPKHKNSSFGDYSFIGI